MLLVPIALLVQISVGMRKNPIKRGCSRQGVAVQSTTRYTEMR